MIRKRHVQEASRVTKVARATVTCCLSTLRSVVSAEGKLTMGLDRVGKVRLSKSGWALEVEFNNLPCTVFKAASVRS